MKIMEVPFILPSSILARIKVSYDAFGASSQKLADYILSQGPNCASQSIKDLAKSAGVSTATVSRFSTQLGFQSFSQFRWALSSDNGSMSQQKEREVNSDDSPKVVADKLLSSNLETLNETFSLLTNEQLESAANLMNNSQHLGFFGLGSSNIVALDCYHKFLRTPLHVFHSEDYHIQIMTASKMTKDDVAILISHTGNDSDILYIANILKQRHVPMITITSFAKSSLESYGTVSFNSISSDHRYRTEALLSVTSQIAITDTLYMLVDQHYEKESAKIVDTINDGLADRHLG